MELGRAGKPLLRRRLLIGQLACISLSKTLNHTQRDGATADGRCQSIVGGGVGVGDGVGVGVGFGVGVGVGLGMLKVAVTSPFAHAPS